MQKKKRPRAEAPPCWRGKEDPTPFVPGIPAEIPRAGSLRALYQAMSCCTRCELALGRTRVVLGTGPTRAELMLIGEGPGADEDRKGEPFVGASGRLVERLLNANGFQRADVFITNIVACRPPANRTPKAREVLAHAPWLEEQLRLVRPRAIMTLGRVAFTYFVPGGKITQSRGAIQCISRDGRDVLLLPTFHPAATLRRRELLPDLEADFAQLPALLRDAADR